MKKGKIWKFKDNVDTDQIIASQYLLLPTIEEMGQYTFESLRPGLANGFQPNDVVVAGNNFGCGSSREQAPLVLKALGAGTIIAKSFARIFFRNAINNGLLVIENNEVYDLVGEGEKISIEVENHAIILPGGNRKYFGKLPKMVLDMISCGGLVNYWKQINSGGNA